MATKQQSNIRHLPTYQIRVQGKLDQSWLDWLDGSVITSENDSSGAPIACIDGIVADQAALRGILIRLWDLNLTLISLSRTDLEQNTASTIERPQPDSLAASN